MSHAAPQSQVAGWYQPWPILRHPSHVDAWPVNLHATPPDQDGSPLHLVTYCDHCMTPCLMMQGGANPPPGIGSVTPHLLAQWNSASRQCWIGTGMSLLAGKQACIGMCDQAFISSSSNMMMHE